MAAAMTVVVGVLPLKIPLRFYLRGGFRFETVPNEIPRPLLGSKAMAENSKIGWTNHTMNFWWGCEKVSEECKFCYISPIMKRAGKLPFDGPIRTKNWTRPAKWHRRATRTGDRPRIFTCSMSDFFHPGADRWRGEAWEIIRECNQLDWLILTKRPEFIRDRLPADWGNGYANVWLGVTVGVRKSLKRLRLL